MKITDKKDFFIVYATAQGKPRMTQRDKWLKRPCVSKYRAYSDKIKLAARSLALDNVVGISWTAYIPFPKSYSKSRKQALAGTYHDKKPDRDNIDKGILDALFKDDSKIAFGELVKLWDDGKGARIEILLHKDS